MKVLVVGSGAGGAMAARHLTLSGAEVHILEAGPPFRPLTRKVRHTEPLRRVGALGAERNITRLFPHMHTTRSGELVGVRGVGAGGCTVLSCGNMIRTDRGLKEIGLDLEEEFDEIESLLPICTVPRDRWRQATRDMFDAAERLGLSPTASPKAMDVRECADCGMCELGCKNGSKWDSRAWVDEACEQGAVVRYGHQVQRVLIEKGSAVGVQVLTSSGQFNLRADKVVLAAGGIGTAQILISSGMAVEDGLWIDPVMTIGGTIRNANQLKEMPMAWYCRGSNYMISPYLDLLSHFFHPAWRAVGVRDRVGLMIKLADASTGRVDAKGRMHKVLTPEDQANLQMAIAQVEDVMSEAGVKGPFVPGMINGGHLGGTRPLCREDVEGMRPAGLPEGLWLADLSLAPLSQGMPTMMLAAALGLRVAKVLVKERPDRLSA